MAPFYARKSIQNVWAYQQYVIKWLQTSTNSAQSKVFLQSPRRCLAAGSQRCSFNSAMIFKTVCHCFSPWTFCHLLPCFVSEGCLCFVFDVNILRLRESFATRAVFFFCDAAAKTQTEALLSCLLKLTQACNCQWICPLKLKLLL